MHPNPAKFASRPSSRIQPVWAPTRDAPAPWHLGLYCYYKQSASSLPGRIQINRAGRIQYPRILLLSVRGLLAWGACLLVLTELSAAAFIYSRYREQPGNLVTYPDLALPWRWSGIESLRGQTLLAQGKVAFDERQFPLALALLGAGLSRHADDPDARLRLGLLYVLFLRRDKADATLLGALDQGDPGLDFFNGAIPFLKDSDHPSQLADFCRRARALVREDDPKRAPKLQLLDTTAAYALLALDRREEALATASALQATDPDFVGRFATQAALEQGDISAALVAVQAWRNARPDSRLALATAIGVNAKAGRPAELDALLSELRRLDPADPGFAAMGVVQNLFANRPAEARAAFDECILRYGAEAPFLDNLARDIGRTGRLDLLDRLETVMNEHGFDPQILLFSRLLAQLDQADWSGAAKTQKTLASREATLAPDVQIFTRTAGTLIEICTQDTAGPKLVLLDLLSRSRGRLRLYIEIIDWLVAAQRWQTAQSAVVLAEGVFPQSVQLAARRALIAPKIDAYQVSQAASSVRSVRVHDEADTITDGDTLLVTLDRQRDRLEFDQALRTIQSVRHRDPAWLSSIKTEIDRREIEFSLDAKDLPRLQSATRQYLRDPHPERLAQACEFARARHAAGQQPTARILLGEVLRQAPDHPLATQLLNAWEEAEKKTTP